MRMLFSNYLISPPSIKGGGGRFYDGHILTFVLPASLDCFALISAAEVSTLLSPTSNISLIQQEVINIKLLLNVHII